MALPGKILYKLSEVAERWGKTEDDLMHFAAQRVLVLSCWFDGYAVIPHIPFEIFGKIIGKEKHLKGTWHESYVQEWATVDGMFIKGLLGHKGRGARVDWLGSKAHHLLYPVEGPLDMKHFNSSLEFAIAKLESPFTVSRTDLVVMAEEVARLETEHTELRPEDAGTLPTTVSPLNDEALRRPLTESRHTGRILTGWRAIAKHLEVSVSTAKRYAKGRSWPRPGPTGKPTTTSAELDDWRLSTSKKKKNRGAK
jgi:hypothetical protein